MQGIVYAIYGEENAQRIILYKGFNAICIILSQLISIFCVMFQMQIF
jgi:hypothetical protein